MPGTTAFQCDGPGCAVLTTRAPGTQYPSGWPRVSFRLPGGEHETGAFHAPVCAKNWLAAKLPVPPEAVARGETGGTKP